MQYDPEREKLKLRLAASLVARGDSPEEATSMAISQDSSPVELYFEFQKAYEEILAKGDEEEAAAFARAIDVLKTYLNEEYAIDVDEF